MAAERVCLRGADFWGSVECAVCFGKKDDSAASYSTARPDQMGCIRYVDDECAWDWAMVVVIPRRNQTGHWRAGERLREFPLALQFDFHSKDALPDFGCGAVGPKRISLP